MKFFRRNSPIFIIGAIGALAILAIIVLGQNSDSGLTLRETLEATFNVSSRNDKELEDVYFPEEEVVQTPTTKLVERGFDSPERVLQPLPPPTYPLIGIVFEGEYFNPRSYQATQGQIIRWTNATDKPITIVQLIKLHSELDKGIVLSPGESFQLEVYGTGIWTYKELNSDAIGRVLISPGRDFVKK